MVECISLESEQAASHDAHGELKRQRLGNQVPVKLERLLVAVVTVSLLVLEFALALDSPNVGTQTLT